MNKYVQIINSMMYDVAPEPAVLRRFGTPVFLLIAVVVLITVTLVLIKRARAKNTEDEKKPGNSDFSGEDK